MHIHTHMCYTHGLRSGGVKCTEKLYISVNTDNVSKYYSIKSRSMYSSESKKGAIFKCTCIFVKEIKSKM